jgi:hypothetical protein
MSGKQDGTREWSEGKNNFPPKRSESCEVSGVKREAERKSTPASDFGKKQVTGESNHGKIVIVEISNSTMEVTCYGDYTTTETV